MYNDDEDLTALWGWVHGIKMKKCIWNLRQDSIFQHDLANHL